MSDYIKEEGHPQKWGEPFSVTFTLQSGPIKEYGVNGCQIDDVIQWARDRMELYNKYAPCRENALVITKLDEAILWLMKRRLEREARGVEGTKAA